jgi:hypothetical protein
MFTNGIAKSSGRGHIAAPGHCWPARQLQSLAIDVSVGRIFRR